MLAAIPNLAPMLGVAAACRVLGVPRSAYYRARMANASVPADGVPSPTSESELEPASAPLHATTPHPTAIAHLAPSRTLPSDSSPMARRSPRALSPEERTQVRTILNSERFVDCTPREVYATLLDEGRYLCSWSTMYRILRTTGEVTRRRDQPRRTAYAKPELLATGPNQLWSWDITKLKGPVAWTYYYLYVIIDVYSRYVVGWMIAERESADLAETFIAETTAKEGILPGRLTLHADRGSAMTSTSVTQLLVDLGVIKSHSRPSVSDDNPFSEAQFKTVKYHPTFPDRCGSLEDARAWARPFFTWYNQDHHHTGIGLLTPATVHRGQAPVVRAARQATLDAAYQAHPERFVRGQPQPPALPPAVWINPPAASAAAQQTEQEPAGDQTAASPPTPVAVSRGNSGAALDTAAGVGYHAASGSPAGGSPDAAPK
jgi:putative transposase